MTPIVQTNAHTSYSSSDCDVQNEIYTAFPTIQIKCVEAETGQDSTRSEQERVSSIWILMPTLTPKLQPEVFMLV